MHDWLLETRVKVANGGGTAKAIDYSLKRWAALSRYATDGRLPIDNNPVENTIRPIAIGKKNWLFAGSERAGKRAAAIQTLLGHRKTQRARSGSLVARHPGETADLPQQPDRFAVAASRRTSTPSDRSKHTWARRALTLYLHQQRLDTSTPSGRALFQMCGVFAEFERAMIVARVKAGIAKAREQGTKSGRPIGRPTVVTPALERRVRSLRAKGYGLIRIAKAVRCGVGTVQRIVA